MFDLRVLLVLIPALPLAAAGLTAILGPRLLRERSHWPTIIALSLSFLFSLGVVGVVRQGAASATTIGFEQIEKLWTWVNVTDAYRLPSGQIVPFRIDVVLRADGLTAMMLSMVTFIATLVAIYAAGYMHGDRGKWRFFAYVSLFVFSMCMLVLASNFLLLFVFWEAVGLCSYLLIGFWYEKKEAAAAGKKAFLVNRVGDFGFAVAVFLIWLHYGTLNYHDTPEVAGVFGQQRLSGQLPFVGGGIGTAICLLLLLGACGKSAQFPLHVWLPDAMEGPTPVSALIHAATMVTAGVYLVARCTPLYMSAPDAQIVVACVGGLTALMAGLIALTQFDLKRVLAYSTISQLGYMFLALGTGTIAGLTAGMFHLFTHAFFKALLFLGAGSVMHAMGHIIDMRRFGGLRHILPWTHRTFLVGCLALSGIFPFAGFWSKDQIVAAVHEQAVGTDHRHGAEATGTSHGTEGTAHSTSKTPADLAQTQVVNANQRIRTFRALYVVALVTAFLTAFYTFRAYFMTFFGREIVPEEAGDHAHESPAVMWLPLAILAVFAFGVGFVFELYHTFAHFLVTATQLAYIVPKGGFHPGEFHMQIALISMTVALSGIGLASFLYLGDRREVEWMARHFAWFRALSFHKFYLDEIYQWLLVAPLRGLGHISYWVDRWLVDGTVNLSGHLPIWLGAIVRRRQRGLVPSYGLMMAVGMVLILGLGGLLWWGG